MVHCTVCDPPVHTPLAAGMCKGCGSTWPELCECDEWPGDYKGGTLDHTLGIVRGEHLDLSEANPDCPVHGPLILLEG